MIPLSLEINRKQPDDGKQTLGTFNVIGASFSGVTMELPYKDNQHRISCIPPGVYTVIKRNSPKYGYHFHVTDVPNRDMILIHSANYSRQLLGCIAVGAGNVDIDKDGLIDVTASRLTLEKLYQIMPQTFKLTIK
jgi:hypothetical protein